MSSTNRGRARNALDQYETPWSAVEPLLPRLYKHRVILDPCCGTGAMVMRVAKELGGQALGIEVDEKRPMTRADWVVAPDGAVQVRDALSPEPWPRADLIITNPPFSLAMEFVRRALKERHERTVAMLLRLAFAASKVRAEFHRANPSDVFVLSKRPSFTSDGKSDSADYAWFVWGPGRGGRWAVL